MKRMMAAAVAAGRLVVGHGTLRAAGQPQCGSGQNASAASGQQYGTSADVEAKKQADARKYEKAGPNSASEACRETPPAAKGTSNNQKQ